MHIGENTLTAEEAHHAAASRRLGTGTAVTLFDGGGNWGAGIIAAAARHSLTVTVGEICRQPAPDNIIEIAVALPKGKRWQFLVEKLTELGAAAITPVKFARSVVSGSDPENAERWAREACKQCRRAAVPRINPEISLGAWLAAAEKETPGASSPSGEEKTAAVFLAAPEGQRPGTFFQDARPGPRKCACIIGPEGGLTPEENAQCLAAGALPLALGPHILRIETAGIAAAAVLTNL